MWIQINDGLINLDKVQFIAKEVTKLSDTIKQYYLKVSYTRNDNTYIRFDTEEEVEAIIKILRVKFCAEKVYVKGDYERSK